MTFSLLQPALNLLALGNQANRENVSNPDPNGLGKPIQNYGI